MEDSTAAPMHFSHLSGGRLQKPRARVVTESSTCRGGQLHTCIRAKIVALKFVSHVAISVCATEMWSEAMGK